MQLGNWFFRNVVLTDINSPGSPGTGGSLRTHKQSCLCLLFSPGFGIWAQPDGSGVTLLIWIWIDDYMFACGLSAAQVSVIVCVVQATSPAKNNTKPIIMVLT